LNPCPSVLETAILPLNYYPQVTKYVIEIKYRIICILIVFFTFISATVLYKFYIIHLVIWMNPETLTDSLNYFILTSITELFNVFFNMSFFLVKHVLYYFIYYHVVSFLALGLYDREYEYLKCFFITSLFLWFLSTSVFWNMLLPITYDFFFNFQHKSTETLNVFFEPKMDEYLSFLLSIYSQSYTCFQFLLVVITFLEYTNTSLIIIKNLKKFIYIFVLLIATFITPPEIINQMVIFLFLVLTIEAYLFSKILKKNIGLTSLIR
jgi:sec-independent protein translocase protein TatC